MATPSKLPKDTSALLSRVEQSIRVEEVVGPREVKDPSFSTSRPSKNERKDNTGALHRLCAEHSNPWEV
ncbi:hypothetical protein U1Q18_021503 [Sarracenia purpurea var. burkii]